MPTEQAPVPDDVLRELVDHYAAGETIEGLVARYPYSYRKIRTALLDAGVTLRPPRIPLPPTPPGLVNAYRNGASIRQLAAWYGHSYNQTRNMLLAEGVELRGRGAPSVAPSPQVRNAVMVEVFGTGITITEVAERFDLSPNWTGALLRANGAPLPRSGRGFLLDLDFRSYRRRYDAGANVRQLAAAAGISYGAMYRGLASVGTEFRARGGKTRR